MATLTEIVDLDSGVASSEATPEGQVIIGVASSEDTPEGQIIISTAAEEAATKVGILEVTKDNAEEENDKEENVVVSTSTSSAAPAADEEDDDEDVDESLGERLMALAEMFPHRLRMATVGAASSSISLMKSSYSLARQVVWVAVSTSVVLFAPVMFELERLNVEDMMKQDRNRLVLGPGSAMSGPPASPGLMPPPPAR